MSHDEVKQQLEEMGFSCESRCVDAGGLSRDARFEVRLIKRGFGDYSFPYFKGPGLRRWVSRDKGRFYENAGGGYWSKYIKWGQPIDIMMPNLKHPSEVAHNQHAQQLRVFNDFERLTEPEPVALDEVVYAIYMDASALSGGETFEEFCGEFGYDTDSRKAEEAYRGCQDAFIATVRLCIDMERLGELFQEY